MKIRLGKSPITNTIYAGKLNKDGSMWIGEKHDVTEDFYNVMSEVVPVNRAIKISDGEGNDFIFSQFPATEDGMMKAIKFYEKCLYEIPAPIKSQPF